VVSFSTPDCTVASLSRFSIPLTGGQSHFLLKIPQELNPAMTMKAAAIRKTFLPKNRFTRIQS
jgi:hypothetical protein